MSQYYSKFVQNEVKKKKKLVNEERVNGFSHDSHPSCLDDTPIAYAGTTIIHTFLTARTEAKALPTAH